MITPDDITTTVEYREHFGTDVRAGVQLACGVMLHRHSQPVEQAQRECQERIWHAIYGDLERKIYEAKRAAMMNSAMPGPTPELVKVFADLEAMVRNPFSQPLPITRRPLVATLP